MALTGDEVARWAAEEREFSGEISGDRPWSISNLVGDISNVGSSLVGDISNLLGGPSGGSGSARGGGPGSARRPAAYNQPGRFSSSLAHGRGGGSGAPAATGSACVDQLFDGLIDNVDGFFNAKAEMLRSIFVSRKQFDNLIQRDCNGNLIGDFMYNWSESELDFMENFLSVFELGLDQLEKFMSMLSSAEDLLKLDECSILYYLRQVLNGPFACAAEDISTLLQGGSINILASINDGIGSLGNAVRNNISNTVYGLEPVNAALDLYNKLPPYMQENIREGTKTVTNVFQFNMEQVYSDNGKPMINRNPQLRVNSEYSQGFTNLASGALMLKDIPFFNEIKNIATDLFGSIQDVLGEVGSRIFEFRKFVNIFYQEGNQALGVLNAVNRLLVSLDRTEYSVNNRVVLMECKSVLTNILGTPIDSDTTYDLTMQTEDGIYDLYSLDGMWDPNGGRTPITGVLDPWDGVDGGGGGGRWPTHGDPFDKDPWTTAGTTSPVITVRTTPGGLDGIDGVEKMKKRLCQEEDECKEFNF